MHDETRSQEGEYKVGPVKRFLAVIGGADPRILGRAPETAFRFAEIAVVLIGTAVIAGLSMAFALISGVHLPIAAAIPLAVVWALVILNLDRFLTSQMKSTRNLWKLIGSALPRVALAAIIGVIVAVPMTIRIFQSEVDAEVAKMGREQSTALTAELAQSNLTGRRDDQRKQVEQLRIQASGGEAQTGADSRVTAVLDKVERAKADWQIKDEEATQAELLFQCDRYGDETARAKLKDPSKCSPKSGPNGLAAQYEGEAKQLRTQANELNDIYTRGREELSAIESEVASDTATTQGQRRQEAEDALPAALDELRRLDEMVKDEADAARAKVEGATGLLAQIQALGRLSQDDAMGQAHIAVIALFFVIELLPVIVKAFSAYGDPSLYEVTEETEKKALVQEAKIRRDRQIQSVEGEAQRDLSIEADMLEREKALGIAANEFVQAQMHEIVTASLQRWSEEVQRELADPTVTDSGTAPKYEPAMPNGGGMNGYPPSPVSPIVGPVNDVYEVPQTSQRSGLLKSDFVPMEGTDL